MSEISAQQVKELREMTGAGMMECKKALTESDGDANKAVDILRTRGLAAAQKKAGRETNEGLVVACIADDGLSASLVEVNCETDFVSRNGNFAALVAKIANAVLKNDPADADALKTSPVDDGTVEDLVTAAIHTLGENIRISRFVRRTTNAGAFSSYTHGAGRIGVIVEFAFNNPETGANDIFRSLGKDIAMQVAADSPGAVSRDDFAADVIEHELVIYRAQAAESGKPESIQEKIAIGRLEKFFKDSALLEQGFIKDPDLSVRDHVAKISKQTADSIAVTAFERFALGQC